MSAPFPSDHRLLPLLKPARDAIAALLRDSFRTGLMPQSPETLRVAWDQAVASAAADHHVPAERIGELFTFTVAGVLVLGDVVVELREHLLKMAAAEDQRASGVRVQ